MILLLDVGNTRLKWARWDGAFQFEQAVVHDDQPLQLFAKKTWHGVSAVWISLVPRMNDVAGWTAAVQQKCGIRPNFAGGLAQWRGLHSAYAQPEKLGVDRWLALVALWNEQHAPFCVVSAGTALTVDRVDANGQHLGGVIAPGLGSTQRVLLQTTRTAQEDMESSYGPQLGRDSVSAIRQGAFFSAMGVLDRALRAPGANPAERRVITGGDAPALMSHLAGDWQHRPYLVLEGLLALARPDNQA